MHAGIRLGEEEQLNWSNRYFLKTPNRLKRKKGILILTGSGVGSPDPAINIAKTAFRFLNVHFNPDLDYIHSLGTNDIPVQDDPGLCGQIDTAIKHIMGNHEMSECRNWYKGDPILEEYHDHEWCKISHDDDFQFMMLCLEGASVGLSWQIIMHKKPAYCAAFHHFRIDACAAMTDEELEAQMSNTGIIRNRNKIFSVRKNARAVQKIQAEFGSFDRYLWSFTDGKQLDGHWKTAAEIPTVSDVSRKMAADMKKRGIGFAGPVITYSFLQAIGIVNDHLVDCEYR